MTFANCTAAYAAGRSDIPRGDPHYATHLDGNNDGIACERSKAPGGFVPATEPTPPDGNEESMAPSPSPSKTVTGTKVPSNAGAELPTTGPGEATGIGAGLILLGAAAVMIIRRRKTKFEA